MLDDRDYMRQPEDHGSGWRPSFRPRWSWTVILLAVYGVVFLAQLITNHFYPGNLVFNNGEVRVADGIKIIPGYLPLSLEGIEKGYVWQLLTYQFMHAGWFHIFMNSWVIYFFGQELESWLGGKKYLALVLSSGVVGGVVQMLVALLWPQYFGGAVVGASAAGFGLIAAYGAMFPDRELQMLLLFVFPVTLRARTFLIGSAVVALAGFAFPDVILPGVAHAAHLGGMAMGWFFVRKILQGDWRSLGGNLRPPEKPKSPDGKPGNTAEEESDDFLESEVDPILDKISAHGIQSLTARERKILESARHKMTRR